MRALGNYLRCDWLAVGDRSSSIEILAHDVERVRYGPLAGAVTLPLHAELPKVGVCADQGIAHMITPTLPYPSGTKPWSIIAVLIARLVV
jgi:hypothetical protein